MQPGRRLPPAPGLADRSESLHRLRTLPGELRARSVGRQGGELFLLVRILRQLHGLFPTKDYVLETGAENQLCPTGTIVRKFIEKQSGVRYFEYTVDERLCIACGKCVVGCRLMNGSLSLQIRHDRCLNCNECSIGIHCPAEAFRRVPAAAPRLLTHAAQAAEDAMKKKRRHA